MTEIAADGWCYRGKPTEGDMRKIVTLKQHGMTWVGIRAFHLQGGYWVNNNEPESVRVVAWRNLPEPASGFYDRGTLHIPRDEREQEAK